MLAKDIAPIPKMSRKFIIPNQITYSTHTVVCNVISKHLPPAGCRALQIWGKQSILNAELVKLGFLRFFIFFFFCFFETGSCDTAQVSSELPMESRLALS
jgi:hypothetical protein